MIATLDNPGDVETPYVQQRFGNGVRPGTQPQLNGQPAASAVTPTLPATGAPVANAATTIQPQYMSQLFPNGIPTAATYQSGQPQQVGAPSQIDQILQASQNLPQVGTSNVGTSQVGTDSVLDNVGSYLGPTSLQQEVIAQMQPGFTANRHALDETLANAGISGGSAIGGSIDLSNNQNAQLAGALAPYEAQSQQQILAAGTTDANNKLAASGQNAGNRLAASGQNASNRLTASGQNAGNAMTAGNNQASQILQASLANQSAAQQNAQFNTTAANAMGQYNNTNLLQSGQFDANAFNTANQQAANINNQDWIQQLMGQQQLASGGQAGQTSAYTSTFSQPSANSLAGFAPNISAPTPATPASGSGGLYGGTGANVNNPGYWGSGGG